jgi:hypothetical protein
LLAMCINLVYSFSNCFQTFKRLLLVKCQGEFESRLMACLSMSPGTVPADGASPDEDVIRAARVQMLGITTFVAEVCDFVIVQCSMNLNNSFLCSCLKKECCTVKLFFHAWIFCYPSLWLKSRLKQLVKCYRRLVAWWAFLPSCTASVICPHTHTHTHTHTLSRLAD